MKSHWTTYNPLPSALHHYEREIEHTFSMLRLTPPTVVQLHAEGVSGRRKVTALVRHILTARKLATSGKNVLVLWPLLGWWEILLWSSPASRVNIVVHDPRPLRRQIGLGKTAARVARVVPTRISPVTIFHSRRARDHAVEDIGNIRFAVVPHPVKPCLADDDGKSNGTRAVADSAIRVGVFGQWKPARDIQLLAELSPMLAEHRMVGQIAGRGWPEIDGWDVTSEFLPEADVSNRIQGVQVVLIPYLDYYQSGIAIRSVELGTHLVGVRNDFLESLLGSNYPGLLEPSASVGDWMQAIRAVATISEPLRIDSTIVVDRWKEILTGGVSAPPYKAEGSTR